MRKIILLSLAIFLNARENPFAPVGNMSEKKIASTNVVKQYEDFDKQEISLPNNARVLKYVIVGYQILDGSIKTKKVPINGKVDWHIPLLITSKNAITPPLPPQSVKSESQTKIVIPNPPKAPKEKIEGIIIAPESTGDIKVQKVYKKSSYSINKYFNFDIQGDTLTIHSKDRLMRHFIVRKPYKIVLDFAKKNAFYTKTKKIEKEPFKSVTFGSHDTFYRASFLLDGPYPYDVKKEDGKIIIKLR